MKPSLNIALSVLAGFVVGSIVNMGIINAGPYVIPLPDGADVSTMEGLRESMNLLGPVNFITPFLAHALGALAGAFVAAKLALSHRVKAALAVGVLFLFGGISMIIMLGGPLWFKAADLLLAYLPMGYLGAVFAGATKSESE